MPPISVEAISTGYSFRSPVFVSAVRYDTDVLMVELKSPGDGVAVSIGFNEVIGFRVLDEGDLLEFWPHCSAANGWLFRIEQGGWFDQEMARPGFLHEKVPGLREYFLVGQNDCISVLTGAVPRVETAAI